MRGEYFRARAETASRGEKRTCQHLPARRIGAIHRTSRSAVLYIYAAGGKVRGCARHKRQGRSRDYRYFAFARLHSRMVAISAAGMCRNSRNSWCSSGALFLELAVPALHVVLAEAARFHDGYPTCLCRSLSTSGTNSR